MGEIPDAGIVVRDQLLDAIVAHIRRRGDGHLAELSERIIGVVRANDDRLAEADVGADVAMFAAMDLSRGKTHAPYEILDTAAKKAWLTEGCLRAHLPISPGKARSRGYWTRSGQSYRRSSPNPNRFSLTIPAG
jgi:hypothetical protein